MQVIYSYGNCSRLGSLFLHGQSFISTLSFIEIKNKLLATMLHMGLNKQFWVTNSFLSIGHQKKVFFLSLLSEFVILL